MCYIWLSKNEKESKKGLTSKYFFSAAQAVLIEKVEQVLL